MCCLMKIWESVPIPEVKKISALINDLKNSITYWEKFKWSEGLINKSGSFRSVNSWWVWKRETAQLALITFCIFYPHFSLETVFPETKVLHENTNFYFLKTGNLIINWLSPTYAHAVPERLSYLSDKLWKLGDLKIPTSQFLMDWEEFGPTA